MLQISKVCTVSLALLLAGLAVVLASPTPGQHQQQRQLSYSASFHLADQPAKPFPLRILPLGASLTCGFHSPQGNGYREYLRAQLRHAAWTVNYVGSLENGTMRNRVRVVLSLGPEFITSLCTMRLIESKANPVLTVCIFLQQNEGHSGAVLASVAKKAERSIPKAPNVILINAGTNDAIRGNNAAIVKKNMNLLLDRLFDTISETTIVLSTLIPSTRDNGKYQDNVDIINEQYRQIAATRRKEGDRVILAELSHFITPQDVRDGDGTHPSDGGYKKMASVWWEAIKEAELEEFLREARAVEGVNDNLAQDDFPPSYDPDLPAFTPPPQPTS